MRSSNDSGKLHNIRKCDTTKKLAEKYSKPVRPIKNEEAKPITVGREQRNRLTEHLEELLTRPAPLNPPDFEAAHTDLPTGVAPPTIKKSRLSSDKLRLGNQGDLIIYQLKH